MAEVYVAKTKGIGGFEKLVAIKVIHPRFSEDEHFVQMLVEEAKIAVQLNHVNIAQTFDLGCIEDTYYIAMEYVEGADTFRVEKRAKERRIALPIDICCYIAAEICNGLGYAHRKRDSDGSPLGIVHRDISPQNVLVSHSGEVKIVDFGIAKAALRGGQTEVGVIKGKYYYMSPEQAWGDPVDQRTDVFAAGLLLYELLTGEMVYREESNIPALLDKVRKARVPSPRARRKDVPPDVEAALMKAVAKEAGDRFQSAHAFGQELTRCLYQINPTFTASRLAQLMGTLFPEEVRRHSQVLKLPPVDAPSGEIELAPLSRDEFALSDDASVIFDLSEADESTRNDILPFRKAKASAPEAPAAPVPRAPAPPAPRAAAPQAAAPQAAGPRVTGARGDRPTQQLASPRSRPDDETTAQLSASKDEWEEETVLKDDESWDESTLIEQDGRSMKEVMRLLGARAMAGEDDGSELVGEKTTVASEGFPLPPPSRAPAPRAPVVAKPAAAPPAPAPPPPANPAPAARAPVNPGAVAVNPAAAPRPPVRAFPAPGARPPIPQAPGPRPAPPAARPALPDLPYVPDLPDLPDLPAEKTVAMAPAPLPPDAAPLPDLPVEKTVAFASEPEPTELPAEKTVAWDQSSAVIPPPRRHAPGLAGPSPAAIRLGPEADRFFGQGAPPTRSTPNGPPRPSPSAPPGPFDPFGGSPIVSADPALRSPPSADPFVAQPPVGTAERLGKPEPRRWLLGAAVGSLAALVVVGVVGAFVALRHRPTTLEIISVPEGAQVELDGRSMSETPVTVPDVEPGRSYRVQLRRAGYEPREAELRVVEGPNRSVFLLNQIRVSLRIETEPPGGQVWVDNVLRGSAPLDIPGLAAGQRVLLRSSAPGHEMVSREVTLEEDERAPRVVLQLPPSANR